jgi:hypothetical protein
MGVELIRRSGYRMVGGIYLVGPITGVPAEPLPKCECCGQGPNLSRNLTEIKIGSHKGAYLGIVGKHFYPTTTSFIDEAKIQAVSKRIPFVPKNLELGKTKIYLAHERALPAGWGIFAYFVPNQIHKLVWFKDWTPENITRSRENNIELVGIPDGDMDHSPFRNKKLLEIEND